MSRRNKIKLSFPKAIAVTAVFCALVMTQFQGPRQRSHSNRKRPQGSIHKIKTATLENSQPKENIPAVPLRVEVTTQPKLNCLHNFAKLGNSVVEVKENHVELVPVSQLKTFKPVKRISKAPKKSVVAKRRVKPKVAPPWIEEDLLSGGVSSQDALDNPSPLDEIALHSFQETPQEVVLPADPLVSSFQWQPVMDPNFPFELERPLYVKESEFQKMDFTDLKESLKTLRLASRKIAHRISAPESQIAWDRLEDVPTQVVHNKTNQLQSVTSDSKSSGNDLTDTSEGHQNLFADIQDPNSGVQIPPRIETTQARAEVSEVGKAESSPSGAVEVKNRLSVLPSLASAGGFPVLDRMTSHPSERLSNHPQESDAESDGEVEGKIYGEVSADVAALEWLAANKGFVELYLNKVGSRDPQDTIFLTNYQFPRSGQSFEIEGSGLTGKYNLVAGVYVPNSAVPVAQISYAKAISAETYREKIRLNITKASITDQSGRRDLLSPESSVPLNLTLFDGAPSNYRKPNIIKNGEVTFLGMPELGSYQSDNEGNVRVPNVPVSSEMLVEVKAPGYLPTRIVVPISTTAAYSPVYLIEKDKVDFVTNYFTKKPQQSMKSVLMGRVYDASSRAPMAGETLNLSYRKGSAVYFGAFPNLTSGSTLETGLFGFYNIEPSFRAVSRTSNQLSHLLNLESGYGYFVEFGRGGSRTLSGRLTDPFNNQDVVGSVHLVGAAKAPELTDEKGNFKMPALDFPPGVITFEVAAEGYPRTWFTVPWSTREPEKTKAFYMIDLDLIRESAYRIARVKHEKNTGVIAGGAHASLFKKGRERVTVQLTNSRGETVSDAHGPFSLSRAQKHQGQFVLTAENPGFTFFNLPPGEYFLKMQDPTGKAFKTHVVRVGVERVSIVVN